MISAIFEILLLLIVSCLIGIYFTFRYWKSKYQKLIDENDRLRSEIADLSKQLSQAEEALKKEKASSAEAAKKFKEVNAETRTKSREATNTENLSALKKEIALKDEQLSEKEREIEALSLELEKKKISYYKQIDGKRYKAITLKMADESVQGKGDGRISKDDAEKIFDTISDGKSYTQVEKDTMRYLRDNYKWTDSADELFRKKVRSWAAKGHELN